MWHGGPLVQMGQGFREHRQEAGPGSLHREGREQGGWGWMAVGVPSQGSAILIGALLLRTPARQNSGPPSVLLAAGTSRAG